MHEFSLIQNLMKKLELISESHEGKKLVGVKVKLGAFSHISAEHFREHFVHAARGTTAEDAELEVEESKDEQDPHAQDIILESVQVEV